MRGFILLFHRRSNFLSDLYSNTVLHILVLQPNNTFAYQMYNLIQAYENNMGQEALEQIPDNKGLAPFKLAGTEGNMIVSM